MVDPRRTTVNLSTLGDRIEELRSDNAWKALTLAKKVVLLLGEYLELLEKQSFPADRPTDKDGEVALKCWNQVAKGEVPSPPDLIKLAAALESEPDPYELQQKLTKLRELKPNGHENH